MGGAVDCSDQLLVSQPQATFLRDVVRFIDAPLSPRNLSRLQRECTDTMAYKPGAFEPSCGGFAVGSCVTPTGLRNTPEFNGLPATVVGQEGDKLLIEFLGAPGRIFDVPVDRLVPAHPQQGAALEPPTGAATADILAEKLRCAMSHVEAAPDAMRAGEELYRCAPSVLYSVISEFQPTLSPANIERNWSRIIQIYQAHAIRVAETSGIRLASASPQMTQLSPRGRTELSREAAEADAEVVSQLRGVLNFIEAPLSPRTLAEIRRIRGQQQGLPEVAPVAQQSGIPQSVLAQSGPVGAPLAIPQPSPQATGLVPRPSFQVPRTSGSGFTSGVQGLRPELAVPRVTSGMVFDDI
eukprot:Hpha_TRINITY_DN16974_c1_g3::TRINITY_DN16974_c1_g3_i1::g.56935::m.56935